MKKNFFASISILLLSVVVYELGICSESVKTYNGCIAMGTILAIISFVFFCGFICNIFDFLNKLLKNLNNIDKNLCKGIESIDRHVCNGFNELLNLADENMKK